MADPNVTPQEPLPGSPEAEAALAAKFDQSQDPNAAVTPPAADKPTRPDNVPEAYWDAEKGEVKLADLLAAVNKPAGEEKPKLEITPPANTEQAVKTGQEAAAKVGLDYAALEESYRTNGGKFSDEDYAKIDAAGIPREMVDTHVQTRMQLATYELEAAQNAVFSAVGGEEKYGELSSWASANVPKEELVVYNQIMNGTDVAAAKLAAAGMFARFSAAVGSEPNLVNGGGKPGPGDVFRSTEELKAAIRDPRYSRDPAYRKDVEDKLARSDIM